MALLTPILPCRATHYYDMGDFGLSKRTPCSCADPTHSDNVCCHCMQLVESEDYQRIATVLGKPADLRNLNLNFYSLTAAPVAVPLALRSRYNNAQYVMRLALNQMPGLEHLQLVRSGDEELADSLRALLAMPPGRQGADALLREWKTMTDHIDSLPYDDDLDRVLQGMC